MISLQTLHPDVKFSIAAPASNVQSSLYMGILVPSKLMVEAARAKYLLLPKICYWMRAKCHSRTSIWGNYASIDLDQQCHI